MRFTKFIFCLILILGTGYINAKEYMLTGNHNQSYDALAGVPKCAGNLEIKGHYQFLPNSVPLERKDIKSAPKEPIAFSHGVLTDGDPDFDISGIIFNNDQNGPNRPEPNYVKFDFDEPQRITGIVVVPATGKREFNTMRGGVRFELENGRHENKWRYFPEIKDGRKYGNNISPLIYTVPGGYKTIRCIDLSAGFQKSLNIRNIYP